MTVLTILFLLVLLILSKTALIVPSRQAMIKERLGKYAGVLPPGFHILIPFFDRVAYRHEIREQVFEVPAQLCITKDNIQVEVDAIIYVKVMDARLASYGIEDYQRGAVNLAQTTLRSEIGKLSLHQAFSERENLNQIIVEEIDQASVSWGIKVLRYEIMNITPSADVSIALEKQMEAERQRRADVTMAEAEREATNIRSEGKKEEAINMSQGHRQKSINEAAGKAAEITLVAEAMSYSLSRVGEAIGKQGGERAVDMRIRQAYFSELTKILNQCEVQVGPLPVNELKGLFATIRDAG